MLPRAEMVTFSPSRADTRLNKRAVSVCVRDATGPTQVPFHSHRRAQLLYSSNGILEVTTDMGIWVVPANQVVWRPAQTMHEVTVRGAVSTHSLFFKPSDSMQMRDTCCVVTISALLRELILYAAKMDDHDQPGPNERLIEVILDQVKDLPSAPLFLPVADDPRLQKIMDALRETRQISARLPIGGGLLADLSARWLGFSSPKPGIPLASGAKKCARWPRLRRWEMVKA